MKILLVLLTILKGIGLFLLAVILLLLLILFLVLFTPIGYGATGEKVEKLKGSFWITWLFGVLCISGVYEDGQEMALSGKVFGFFLFGEKADRRREKKRNRKRAKAQKKQKKQNAEEVVLTTREKEISKENEKEGKQPSIENVEQSERIFVEEVEEIKAEVDEQREEVVESQESVPLSAMEMESNRGVIRRVKMVDIKEKPPEIETVFQEESEPFAADSFQEKHEELRGKKEKWKQSYQKFQAIQNKKQIFQAVLRFIKRIVKNILPKNLFLKATVGTGDPALTGQLLGAVGIAKSKFGENIKVSGDFTKADLRDVEMRIKGRIYLGSLVVGLARLILEKPVWALIKQYRKGKR